MSAYLFGTGGSCLTFLKRKFKFINEAPESSQHFKLFDKKYLGRFDIKPEDKIVYSFANPYNILLSFSRRGFFTKQFALPDALNGDGKSFLKLKEPTLECYLNYGLDMFNFGNHFQCFYSLPNPVLIIKDESIDFGIIKHWADVDIKSEEGLQKRNSNYTKIDKSVLSKMQNIHGKWAAHYEKLPTIFSNEMKGLDFLAKKDN
jgi:hypothetical protein